LANPAIESVPKFVFKFTNNTNIKSRIPITPVNPILEKRKRKETKETITEKYQKKAKLFYRD